MQFINDSAMAIFLGHPVDDKNICHVKV